MKVSLIAAVAQNGTIGRHNDLPWKIRDDMRFFMRTTKGHVVITGRKNYEAMGSALKNRTNIVVTRSPEFRTDDAIVAHSIEQALRVAEEHGEREVFVIGGAQIYAMAFPYAHAFYRTTVLADVDGDVKFPDVDVSDWDSATLGSGQADEHNEHAFRIELLTRPKSPRSYR